MGHMFSGRNTKSYTLIALVIGIFTIGGVVAYPVISAMLSKNRIIKEKYNGWSRNAKCSERRIAPPPPPPPPPPDAVQQQRFVAPKVTTDSVVTTMAINDDLNAKPNTEAPAAEAIVVEEAKPRLSNRKLRKRSSLWLRNSLLTLAVMKPVSSFCRII